jgi:tRNA(Ile)-lysidine synthase
VIDVAQSHVVRSLLPATNFPPNPGDVACAVSGGADSSALLVLAVAAGLRPTAYHVDHGLRPESHREADVVADLARQLGADFVALRADITPGPNLEARAREARRALLPPGVLTGHTADDQAETILMNLMRGSATEGLAGMRTDHTKPLLNLRRRDTEALCASLGIDVVVDPSNTDPRFQRNRVRHELIPLMNDIARRDVPAIIAREAQFFADDDDYLHELAANIDVHDAVALAAAPLPLSRRAIRRWLADPYPPDAATVERVLDVARGLHPGCDIGGGRQVRRSQQRLRWE